MQCNYSYSYSPTAYRRNQKQKAKLAQSDLNSDSNLIALLGVL